MKTIKDIVREMRVMANVSENGYCAQFCNEFADRIEEAAELEERKMKESIDGLMACCEYRTCRGTCGLLDKDDRTYPCSRANCPHIDDKAVRQ